MKSGKIIFTTVLSALVCFGLLPGAHAVGPEAPDTALAGGNTADGQSALGTLTTGLYNSAFGFLSLLSNGSANFNTGVGAGVLLVNTASNNTAVGAGDLFSNTTGTSNTANGTFALFSNVIASSNTAVGSQALQNNDNTGNGNANGNTAVGGAALFNNVDGSENTAVGTGSGPNVIAGFNNTYVGDFVGTLAADESNTIRIGDLSNGNGAGSLACFIGGIFNNFQPVGGSVVVVTLDRADDHLGWDFGPSQGGSAPIQRSSPQRRSAPDVRPQRPAMLDGKVGKVEKLEAMVAQQQKQIETLTSQLRKQAQTFTAELKEQATQIQKVRGQLEVSKRAPQVVNNP